MLNFITDFDDPERIGVSVRDLSKISLNYFNGRCLEDFIALIPFNVIHLKNDRQKLLYVIKLIRLKRGLDNLDIMKYVKNYRDRLKNTLDK